MAATNQILIFSMPGMSSLVDQSELKAAGYEVVPVSQTQAVESWLTTFLADDLMVIVHPSAMDALKYSAEILENHPSLPIIIITNEVNTSLLKYALEIGIFDYITYPFDQSDLLQSIKHSLIRQTSWQEWNRFTRILANLDDGIIIVDLDGYLLMINRSARDIFLVGEDQFHGKTADEVLQHPDILDILKPQSTPRQSEITLEDGRIYSAQASLIPEVGIAVVIHNITQLKELDRVKTDFVNTISHDLRSPLTAIYGFVSLIDRVGPINEQQADFIHHIQSSVQHITALINDLLDLGRVEADYDVLMQDVNLKEIINQSIESLDYQISEKMQELVLSIPEEIPAITGNPLHLQRMVSNLLENAIKFTPPLGKISIQCRVETSQLIFEVADNGPGIPLNDQPHIFDKFYRGTNISQNTQGTGLGLSIVKSVVDKHHGRIWLDSSPAGTTFSVILPIK